MHLWDEKAVKVIREFNKESRGGDILEEEAIKWSEERTFCEFLEQCPRADWVLWLLVRLDVPNKEILLASSLCLEEIKGMMKHQVSRDITSAVVTYAKSEHNSKEYWDSWNEIRSLYADSFSAFCEAEKDFDGWLSCIGDYWHRLDDFYEGLEVATNKREILYIKEQISELERVEKEATLLQKRAAIFRDLALAAYDVANQTDWGFDRAKLALSIKRIFPHISEKKKKKFLEIIYSSFSIYESEQGGT